MYNTGRCPQVEATNSLGEKETFEIIAHADTCPVCGVAITPERLGAYVADQGDKAGLLEFVYRCPRNECKMVFVSLFRRDMDRYHVSFEGPFKLAYSEPSSVKKPVVPDAVGKLSPRFVDVYGQAMAAEQFRLPEVAGPGYRKAFEVLLKDYVIAELAETDEERATVTKSPRISSLVDTYFGQSKLANVLHRVAWLGNDETHYSRRWEDQDLQDLHNLLKIAVNMIESDLVASEYIEKMP